MCVRVDVYARIPEDDVKEHKHKVHRKKIIIIASDKHEEHDRATTKARARENKAIMSR